MNSYLLIYLGLGVLFNLFLDLSTDTIVKHGIDEEENLRLPIGSKILVGLFWPIGLVFFIIKLIQSEK